MKFQQGHLIIIIFYFKKWVFVFISLEYVFDEKKWNCIKPFIKNRSISFMHWQNFNRATWQCCERSLCRSCWWCASKGTTWTSVQPRTTKSPSENSFTFLPVGQDPTLKSQKHCQTTWVFWKHCFLFLCFSFKSLIVFIDNESRTLKTFQTFNVQ